MPVAEYVEELQSTWLAIDHFQPIKNPNEWQSMLQSRMFRFLMGLNPEYEQLRSQLLNRERVPTLEEAILAVLDKEKRRKIVPRAERDEVKAGLLARSKPVKGGEADLGKNPKRRGDETPDQKTTSGKSSQRFCTYCKKRSHYRDTCYSLYPHLRPPRANVVVARPTEGSSSDSGAEVPKMVPVEELERVKEELEKLRAARSFTSMVLSGKFHSKGFRFSKEWIMDTGATDHMTPHRHKFIKYIPCYGERRVFTAEGEVLPVLGIGTVEIDKLGVIENVIHVPDLRAQLLSPQRFVKDLNLIFSIAPDGCFIYDKGRNLKTSPFKEMDGLIYAVEAADGPPATGCLAQGR